MEVKDLLNEQIEELTDKQKELLEIDLRRKKYKILKKYLFTPEYKDLVKKFETKANDILVKIEKELDNRRNGWVSKATQSELNFSLQFYDFQCELANALWNSEAEQILKNDLLQNADNTYTHLTNKIEELYDVPSYSDLDLLKKARVEYALIRDRIETMVWFYNDNIEVENNPNPYEEQKN